MRNSWRYFFIYGVLTGLIIVVFISFYRQIYLINPHNSPNKAYEIKKTYKVPSYKTCPQTVSNFGVGNDEIVLPIIMYHYVDDDIIVNDAFRKRMRVDTDNFRLQLDRLLNAGYETVFMRDVARTLNGETYSCYPSVALTFDDGYEDFYTDVFPVLKDRNAKATVYVISNYINRKGFMTEAQITEIAASGLVEIGSHTLDHPDLTQESSPSASYQITKSKAVIESIIGGPVYSFAYPIGAHNDLDVELVRSAGYTNAVTVQSGAIYGYNDVFTLPRVRPERLFH